MSMHRWALRTPLLGAVGVLCLFPCLRAFAQQQSQQTLEQVTVTATRAGTQNLQDVPMAVSVISPADMQAYGLAGITDIANEIPSLNMQSLAPGINKFDMRGLVTTALDITNTGDLPLVQIYLDDVPISMQGFTPDLKVFDLERIEVLPGPQGTLYGAGSMAGTIRMLTVKPDLHNLTGYVEAEGSFTDYGAGNNSERGLINIPLVNNVAALRLSAYRADVGGWIDNWGTGQNNANSNDSTQARAALRVMPNENLTIDASYVYSRMTVDGENDVYAGLGDYTFDSLVPEKSSDDFRLSNLTLHWKVQSFDLLSSTSYLQRDVNSTQSFDYSAEYLGVIPDRVAAYETNNNQVTDFTEELRVVSPQDKAFRFTGGAFFEDFKRFYPENAVVPGMDEYLGINSVTDYLAPFPDDLFYGTIDIRARQLAFFGEGTYSVTSSTDVTAGLRYFDYRQDFNLFFAGLAGALGPGEPTLQSGTEKASGVNPRFVLKQKLSSNVMAYVEASRGFRYGGVNEPVPPQFCGAALAGAGLTSAPLTFGPDHLWNYSIGEKSTLLENRLTINSDVFLIDWGDVQTVHNLSCGYYFTQNAGDVRSQGVELQAAYRVASQLTIGFNGSFTDAYARGDIPNIEALSGERSPYFPRWILNLNATYVQPVGHGDLTFRADYTHRGDSFTGFNSTQFGYAELPPMNIVNLAAGYSWGPAEVSLFVNNLTNDRQISSISVAPTGSPQPGNIDYVGRPRTIGLRVHYNF
jgi:iron complex outermembrane recepter protein